MIQKLQKQIRLHKYITVATSSKNNDGTDFSLTTTVPDQTSKNN